MVELVVKEVPNGSVIDVFHIIRRRCPEWAVTPHRVRKALTQLVSTATKKGGAASGTGTSSSPDGAARAYPHDIVELRGHLQRSKAAQWQWRGQVLRTAGYDDGEADSHPQELPPGHCSVLWLSRGFELYPNEWVKESSLRVLDRPWVLGDRVARADDPLSLGTIVAVKCHLSLCRFGNTLLEVPAQSVRAVGGFRSEDWVAMESSRWVGKIEEAVFRVEVELSGTKSAQPRARVRAKPRPPVCVFQVSSEGLQGLEPAIGDDVTPQELSPHFPGQRVRAPLRLWKQAEWVRGSLGRRAPRRGAAITGIVTSVECTFLAVRWLTGVNRDAPPDEWVAPDVLRPLAMANSSEGWALGEHVVDANACRQASIIAGSRTVADVRWADGTVEENISSVNLCPRPHVSAHDFLPLDFVSRSSDDALPTPAPFVVPNGMPPEYPVPPYPPPPPPVQGDVSMNEDTNDMYMDYSNDTYGGEAAEEAAARLEEIVPQDVAAAGGFAAAVGYVPLAVVTCVDLQARTAVVRWVASAREPNTGTAATPGEAGETEEVSVFELAEHPEVDVRLADAVLIPHLALEDGKWVGRVCMLSDDGQALVELLDGSTVWHDARRLLVVDDGDGSMGSNGDSGDEAASDDDPEDRSKASSVAEDAEEDDGEGAEPPQDEKPEPATTWQWSRWGMNQVSKVSRVIGLELPLTLFRRDLQEDAAFGTPASSPGVSGDAASSAASAGVGDGEAHQQEQQMLQWQLYSMMAEQQHGSLPKAPPHAPPHAPPMMQHELVADGLLPPRPPHAPPTYVPVPQAGAPGAGPSSSSCPASFAAFFGGSAGGSSSSSAPPSDVLPFDMCGEDVEPTDHHFLKQECPGSKSMMMAVRREMTVLKKGLLDCSEGVVSPIIVRAYSSRSDLFRAMVVGTPGTPYANVPFFFDFALPPEYPRGPPAAFFHAHYVGNERLNPNLYVDGKVCLSLLGTWAGPSWDPTHSTMLQVLVSLQGLVLVDEPYFNEPGHECDAGTEQGKQASALYNEHARILSLRAALNVAQSPPLGFEEIVTNFFVQAGPKLVADCAEALSEASASKSSSGYRKVLAKLLPRLVDRWGSARGGAGAACAGTASSAAAAAVPAAASASATADRRNTDRTAL